MLSIGLSFLCIMAACNSKEQVPEPVEWPSSELSAIDSLMWSQPDSALLRLLPWFDTCCRDTACHVSTATAYNRHYANLLLSELLYKNYYPQTNRTELQQAVAYFDSLVGMQGADTLGADTFDVSLQGRPRRDARRASAKNATQTNIFLAARAHYINGVGYYENDSVIQACAEYLKTLEIMENHFEEKELVGHKAQFMAFTYTRLTNLFSDLYLHEQAIYFSKMSLLYYHKHEALIWHIARMLEETASHYEMMGIYDSAFFYYYKGLTSLSDTNDLTYRDISSHLAYLSYKDGKSAEHSLNQLHYLLVHAESSNEFLTRCAIIGEIFFHEKQFDSAVVYLDKVFQNTNNENLKKQDAKLLVEIFKAQGRMSEVLEYAEFITHFATVDEDLGTIKSQLAELYNSYKQHKLEQQHKQKTKKQTIWSIGVITGLLIVTLGVFVLYRKYKRKKQSLEVQIKEEQYAHEIKQKALSGRLKQSNEALRMQQKETSELAKEMSLQRKETDWNHLDDFMSENICNDIATALRGKQIKREAKSGDYPELHLNDAQLHDLSVAVEKHFNGFEKTLTDLYPKISRNAMHQCLLYLLGLEDVQIAALLSCDYSTVKRRSAKLKQAFGTEKELRQFIREFVL